MFRASDIFGRKPLATPDRPSVPAKAAAVHKRLMTGAATTKTWDPATGKFFEEEIPVELREMMGPSKKAKTVARHAQDVGGAHVLGPASVGMAPRAKDEEPKASPQGDGVKCPSCGNEYMADSAFCRKCGKARHVDKTAPWVEYRGFSKVDLNDRYFERANEVVNERPTYWGSDGQFFIYWQGETQRWSICDVASLADVKTGQLRGWAYRDDSKYLCGAAGWMEAWDGSWLEPEIEVCYRSTSYHEGQWNDPALQKSVEMVEMRGFAMNELNARYIKRPTEVLQGRPSYWEPAGVYFIYWQHQMRRWAICDLKCLDAIRGGQCPGWAYRRDSLHFANACGWMEMIEGDWTNAVIETAVISTSNKGLKVEFSGFGKQDLNTQYLERSDEKVQGRATFWDTTDTYFIYWQSKVKRWAVCDRPSLSQAQEGLTPGWAYRTDSQHFTKSSGDWMEPWGRTWRKVRVTCTVLEGTVRPDASSLVKAELPEDGGAQISMEQYQTLVRRVYEQKNPGKLPDLPQILGKYEGKEHELFAMVCEKYQVDADAFVTAELQVDGAFGEGQGEDDYPHLEGADCPKLAASEYTDLVKRIYQRHNPSKLPDLGKILVKYRGRERDLYQEVCNKYRVHPAKFHAGHTESGRHAVAEAV